jgi:hypothetical protein
MAFWFAPSEVFFGFPLVVNATGIACGDVAGIGERPGAAASARGAEIATSAMTAAVRAVRKKPK